jgi:rRNA maturation endonuclease Nob1
VKHLKESQDTWAGSNYAYNQTVVTRNAEIFKVNDVVSYHCDSCEFDFFTYDENEEYCTICGSESINKIK